MLTRRAIYFHRNGNKAVLASGILEDPTGRQRVTHRSDNSRRSGGCRDVRDYDKPSWQRETNDVLTAY